MQHQKGNTLLIELVIVLFFFALSQAIILQVFARAQQTNLQAQAQSFALLAAEDVAETLAVSDQPENALLALGFTQTDNSFQRTDDRFSLHASITRFTQPSGMRTTITISATRGESTLFTLPAVRYAQEVTQ